MVQTLARSTRRVLRIKRDAWCVTQSARVRSLAVCAARDDTVLLERDDHARGCASA
jgi:hypothetical protein